jgi:hypothetical protein
MFDPREGYCHRQSALQERPVAARCLATNEQGDRLVVLHIAGPAQGRLESYLASGAGFTHYGGLDFRLGQQRPWLTPLTTPKGGFVGLWEDEGLAILQVPDLMRVKRIPPPEDNGVPQHPLCGFLAGPADWVPGRPFAGLVWGRDFIWAFQAGSQVTWTMPDPRFTPNWFLDEALVYPSPAWPRSIAVGAWCDDVEEQTAGVASGGIIHWRSGSERARTMPAQGPYLVAVPTSAGRVAGVRASGIDWLRREGTRLVPWSLTSANLAGAVFAALSPLPSELLVVCGDGELVRVPMPSG